MSSNRRAKPGDKSAQLPYVDGATGITASDAQSKSNIRTPKTPTKGNPSTPKPGPKSASLSEIVESGLANAALMDAHSGIRHSTHGNVDDWEDEDDESEEPEESEVDPSLPTAWNAKRNREKKKKFGKQDPNGRVDGRKLVMWHRPRMMEKLMLHVQYECHRRGLIIPWDNIVHRLCKGSSGASAIQHLNKLRDVLIMEGHMVPPQLGKVTQKQDPHVRGYIRDMDATLPTQTRVVDWHEDIVDLKENLVVPGVVRGSGNYRKGLPNAIEKATKNPDGKRRNRLPLEIQERIAGKQKNKKRKQKASIDDAVREDSVDPAELQSDADFDPSATKKRKYGLRKSQKKSFKLEDSEDEDKIEFGGEMDADDEFTPIKPRRKVGAGLLSPPKSSLPVKFQLSSAKLANFPSGTNGGGPSKVPGLHPILEENDQDSGPAFQPNLQLKEKFEKLSYQTEEMDGTPEEHKEAIPEGIDTLKNGTKLTKRGRGRQGAADAPAVSTNVRSSKPGRLANAASLGYDENSRIPFSKHGYEVQDTSPGYSYTSNAACSSYEHRTNIIADTSSGYGHEMTSGDSVHGTFLAGEAQFGFTNTMWNDMAMNGNHTPPYGANAQDIAYQLVREDTPPYGNNDDGEFDTFATDENDVFSSPPIVDGNSIAAQIWNGNSSSFSSSADTTSQAQSHFINTQGSIWRDDPLAPHIQGSFQTAHHQSFPSTFSGSYFGDTDYNDENAPPAVGPDNSAVNGYEEYGDGGDADYWGGY